MRKMIYTEEQREEVRKKQEYEMAMKFLGILKDAIITAKDHCGNRTLLSFCVTNGRDAIRCVDEYLKKGNSIGSLGIDEGGYRRLVSDFNHWAAVYHLHVLKSGNYDRYPHCHFDRLMELVNAGKINLSLYGYTVDGVRSLFRKLLVRDANEIFSVAMNDKKLREETFASVRRHYLIPGITNEHSFNIDFVTLKYFQDYLAEKPPIDFSVL